MKKNLVSVSKVSTSCPALKKAILCFSEWHSKKKSANVRIPEVLREKVKALASEYSTKELMGSLSLSYGAIRKITRKGGCRLPKVKKRSKTERTLEAKWIEVTPHIQNFPKPNFIDFFRPDGFKMTISDQILGREFASLFLQNQGGF